MSSVIPAPAAVSFDEIPVVSLAGWRTDAAGRRSFAEDLVQVCHEIGFLLLVDHGVDMAFVERCFDALDGFFSLPEEVKATIDKRGSRHFRGWERVGAELTDNRVDHREQLDVATEYEARAADVLPPHLRLDGPNQWLPEEALPGFRATVGEVFDRFGGVAREVLAALSLGLGLEEDHLGRVFGERPYSFVKCIDYPVTPAGEAGVNAHHDVGFLSVLCQHRVGGLQVQNPDGRWIDVPLVPGALVVNLGENLQSMTGNYLVATMHRVIATAPRRSLAYFYGGDLRMPLDPLPLDGRFAEAVAASPRHAGAGFMATRNDLLDGRRGTTSCGVRVYGEQLWNYLTRSYPENMRLHHPDLAESSVAPGQA